MLTQQEFVQVLTAMVTAGRNIPVTYQKQPVIPLFSALEILKSFAPNIDLELNFDPLADKLTYVVRDNQGVQKPAQVLTLVPAATTAPPDEG